MAHPRSIHRLVLSIVSRAADGDRAAYDPDRIREALQQGLVERLLLIDEMLGRPLGDELVALARGSGARVVVIDAEHEAGELLASLSGVGAQLRGSEDASGSRR